MEYLNLIASISSILSLLISIFTLSKVYQIINRINIGNENNVKITKSKGTNISGGDINN